jgi:hypothetical protein
MEIVATESGKKSQKAKEAKKLVHKAKVLLFEKKIKVTLARNDLKKARHVLWLQHKVNKYIKKLDQKSESQAQVLVDGLQLDKTLKSHRRLMESTNFAIIQHNIGLRRLNFHIRRMSGINNENQKIVHLTSQVNKLRRNLSQNKDEQTERNLRARIKRLHHRIIYHRHRRSAWRYPKSLSKKTLTLIRKHRMVLLRLRKSLRANLRKQNSLRAKLHLQK